MSRSPIRHFAVCICLAVGMTIPAAELVHGFAHHEAAHHEAAHDEHDEDAHSAAVKVPEHDGDHAHAVTARAITVRFDGAPAVAVPVRVPLLVEHASRLQSPAPASAGERRWSSTHAPPPGTRAPPIV